MQLQLPLDVVRGEHEKCAWCKKKFAWVNDAFVRVKGLDEKYYCNETHASAPYLQVQQ